MHQARAVDEDVATHASGRAQRVTVGTDTAFDTEDVVADRREGNVSPHVARTDNGRRSAIDDGTTRHSSAAAGLRIRKRIAEADGAAPTPSKAR